MPGGDRPGALLHPAGDDWGLLPEFEVVCFGFWLTALTWRRTANDAAAG